MSLALTFNTQLEMPKAIHASVRQLGGGRSFNTPLEMQIVCGLLFTTSAINFQCSIRDAALKEDTYAVLASLTFNTPLEMLEGVLRGRDWRLFFQYSIRDAGGFCLWFLWVFKFLCRRVWVSCGGLLTVVVLVWSLCWCAESKGVCFCVFFLLGVGLRREVARRFIITRRNS